MIVQMGKTHFRDGRSWGECVCISLSASHPFPQPLVALAHFPATTGAPKTLLPPAAFPGPPCLPLPVPSHWGRDLVFILQCPRHLAHSPPRVGAQCARGVKLSFKLCNALISLEKKKGFLWSNKFGKHYCIRHPLFIDSQCTSAYSRFQEVQQKRTWLTQYFPCGVEHRASSLQIARDLHGAPSHGAPLASLFPSGGHFGFSDYCFLLTMPGAMAVQTVQGHWVSCGDGQVWLSLPP